MGAGTRGAWWGAWWGAYSWKCCTAALEPASADILAAIAAAAAHTSGESNDSNACSRSFVRMRPIGTGRGPTPERWQQSPQNGWSPKNGTCAGEAQL